MTLLELRRAGKLRRRGSHEQVVLHDISLSVDAGELVVVWGAPRSGRSALLRIAAGVEPPDSGVVCFAGRDLASRGGTALGSTIGYCRAASCATPGTTVQEQLTIGLLAHGVAAGRAAARAREALARVEAVSVGVRAPYALNDAEAVRVSIARALVLEPRMIVIDEPIKGVAHGERDRVLLLLRSLADEGVAVLASTGDVAGLAGADRALTLADGELSGRLVPRLAPVVALSQRRARGRRAVA